jgi:hypothetical protein
MSLTPIVGSGNSGRPISGKSVRFGEEMNSDRLDDPDPQVGGEGNDGVGVLAQCIAGVIRLRFQDNLLTAADHEASPRSAVDLRRFEIGQEEINDGVCGVHVEVKSAPKVITVSELSPEGGASKRTALGVDAATSLCNATLLAPVEKELTV